MKHFIGFSVFSLIVGTAVFVSAFFYSPATFRIKHVSPPPRVAEDCPFREEKVKIVQSTYDPATKELNTSFLVRNGTTSAGPVRVSLVFFSREDSGISKILAVEDRTVDARVSSDGRFLECRINSSEKWLDPLTSKDNLYVVIKSTDEGVGKAALIDLADQGNATPVLLIKGR